MIELVSEMDEAHLDALLVLLQPAAQEDYELSEEDKWVINERAARYERGESKVIPAASVSRRARQALKKRKK